MRYVAAYLLANLGGNQSPSADDIKKILDSVGISVEDAKLEKVLNELKNKDINDVIAEGKEKLAGIPSGGVAAGGAAPAGGAGDDAPKEEEKKEEAKKESSESSDDDMGMGLFD